MNIRDLLKEWEETASAPRTGHEYHLPLPVYHAAKVAALAEMYPGRTQEQIIVDLLGTALDELQKSFAYVEGEEVISWDEHGDPVFRDAGLTPRFHALTEAHLRRLKKALHEKD